MGRKNHKKRKQQRERDSKAHVGVEEKKDEWVGYGQVENMERGAS